MTCAELRERIVDPASASLGGHAPVVAHLQECAACRASARDYAALDRLLRPARVPEPPPDLESRLLQRLSAAPASPWRRPAVLAAAAAGSILLVFFAGRAVRRPPGHAPGPAPVDIARAAASAPPAPVDRPPDIVAVRSTPISFDRPPLTNEEKRQAVELHEFDFLSTFEALARLDAFFPEPVGPRAPAAVPAGGFPSRPPDSPDGLTGRTLDWQRTSAQDRARLVALEAAFRNRPEDERALLEARWMFVKDFSNEQRAGLRRLASRLDEVDAKTHDRLEAEIRLIGRLPKDQRVARWRALPFAQPLTGQELESAERLLLSR
ncbi:MAG: DUF3106 domain-containing protein [Thermoanaerobaculia bacterium]